MSTRREVGLRVLRDGFDRSLHELSSPPGMKRQRGRGRVAGGEGSLAWAQFLEIRYRTRLSHKILLLKKLNGVVVRAAPVGKYGCDDQTSYRTQLVPEVLPRGVFASWTSRRARGG